MIKFFVDNNKQISISLSSESTVVKHFNKLKELIPILDFVIGGKSEYDALIQSLGGEINDINFELTSKVFVNFLQENKRKKRNTVVAITNGDKNVNLLRINELNNIDLFIKYYVPGISPNEIVDSNGCGDCKNNLNQLFLVDSWDHIYVENLTRNV